MSQHCNLCNKKIEKNIHVFSCKCDGVFHKECLENFYKYAKCCPQCNKNYYYDNNRKYQILKIYNYKHWDDLNCTLCCLSTTACALCFCTIS